MKYKQQQISKTICKVANNGIKMNRRNQKNEGIKARGLL